MTSSGRERAIHVPDWLKAGAPAALLSGIPSTVHALVTEGDPLAPTMAAGSILLPRERRRARLLAAAVPAHLGLSAAWAIVMGRLLPRRHGVIEGTIAGLAIAAIDLGLIGRRFPRIRELDPLPQIADHIAYGVIVATVLAHAGSQRAVDRDQGSWGAE